MAIKISNTTVIDQNRYGKFNLVNPGSYTEAERDAITGQQVGDVIYNNEEEALQVWNGEDWVNVSGGAKGEGQGILIPLNINIACTVPNDPTQSYYAPFVQVNCIFENNDYCFYFVSCLSDKEPSKSEMMRKIYGKIIKQNKLTGALEFSPGDTNGLNMYEVGSAQMSNGQAYGFTSGLMCSGKDSQLSATLLPATVAKMNVGRWKGYNASTYRYWGALGEVVTYYMNPLTTGSGSAVGCTNTLNEGARTQFQFAESYGGYCNNTCWTQAPAYYDYTASYYDNHPDSNASFWMRDKLGIVNYQGSGAVTNPTGATVAKPNRCASGTQSYVRLAGTEVRITKQSNTASESAYNLSGQITAPANGGAVCFVGARFVSGSGIEDIYLAAGANGEIAIFNENGSILSIQGSSRWSNGSGFDITQCTAFPVKSEDNPGVVLDPMTTSVCINGDSTSQPSKGLVSFMQIRDDRPNGVANEITVVNGLNGGLPISTVDQLIATNSASNLTFAYSVLGEQGISAQKSGSTITLTSFRYEDP